MATPNSPQSRALLHDILSSDNVELAWSQVLESATFLPEKEYRKIKALERRWKRKQQSESRIHRSPKLDDTSTLKNDESVLSHWRGLTTWGIFSKTATKETLTVSSLSSDSLKGMPQEVVLRPMNTISGARTSDSVIRRPPLSQIRRESEPLAILVYTPYAEDIRNGRLASF